MTLVRRVILSITVLSLAAPLVAQDLLVASRFTNNVLRFDAKTGAFKSVFATGNGMTNPNGLAIGPDGNLYVGLGDEGTVLRYDGQTGAFISRFVSVDATTPPANGGFNGCRAIKFGPDGDLYVAAGPNDKILRFNGTTGKFVGIAAQSATLSGPVGLAIAADGTLYVGGALDNAVHVFRNGSELRKCAGGTHTSITGVALGPDGLLYASSTQSNGVIRYKSETCEFLGVFAGGLQTSIYMTFDRENNLIVGSFADNRVAKFDIRTGASIPFIASGAGGLSGTHDFAFIPERSLASTTPQSIIPAVGKTSVWITNPGDNPLIVQLRFHSGAGASQAGAIDPAQLTIGPHVMMFWRDVLSEAFHTIAETTGVIVVEVPDGSSLPLVSARTGDRYDALSLAAASNGETWIHGLAADAKSTARVGVVNFSTAEATVTLSVWSEAGQRVGNDVAVTVPARSSAEVGSLANGTDRFSVRASGSAYALYAIKLDKASNDPTILFPVVARVEQWIDGVGSVHGVGDVAFRTSLSLANRTTTDAHVRLKFTARNDIVPSPVTDVTVSAGSSVFFDDVTSNLFNETAGAGFMSITSDVPITAWSRAYADRGAQGTFGAFIPSFSRQELIGANGVVLHGLAESEVVRTNFGAVNVTGASVEITFTAVSSDGTATGSRTYTIAPNQTTAVFRVLDRLGVPRGTNAQIRVTTSVVDAVFATALVVDNASSDPGFVRPLR